MFDFSSNGSRSEIDFSDLDLSDQRYKISFSLYDTDFLAKSIKETGLITPPVVRLINEKYIIVSGFNRINAQRLNNTKKCIVEKIPPDATDYNCLLIAITALAFKRPLSLAEQILSIRCLNHFLDEKQIEEKAPALFNTRLNTRYIKDLIAITSLPELALTLIDKGQLSFKSARRLADLDTETAESFLTLFSHIKASQNKQLEIILNIMEISARESIEPIFFFNHQSIQTILKDKNKEPGLKTTLLRSFLFEQRFPTIAKTRTHVKEKIECVKFGSHVKFLPPENFEGQHYTTSFTAKNYHEFKARVDHLAKLLDKKELKEILG